MGRVTAPLALLALARADQCNNTHVDAGGGEFPTAFNPLLDLVSLHYDCAADPDDMVSAAADRALLEASFGTDWLRRHALPVVGAFGLNTDYKEAPCERVAQAVWGDATGFVRASKPSLGREEANASRAAGVQLTTERWALAIEAGGQVYVKEGGQSDFTMEVVRALEARRGAPAGSCVHVVQHSKWNEEQNSEAGWYEWLTRHVDYVGALTNGHGPVIDGNGPMQSPLRHEGDECGDTPEICAFREGRSPNAHFIRNASASWMGCGWDAAFAEFEKLVSWCEYWRGGQKVPALRCLDFSDTHELAVILGVAPLSVDGLLGHILGPPVLDTPGADGRSLRTTDCSLPVPSAAQPLHELPPHPPDALPPAHTESSPPASRARSWAAAAASVFDYLIAFGWVATCYLLWLSGGLHVLWFELVAGYHRLRHGRHYGRHTTPREERVSLSDEPEAELEASMPPGPEPDPDAQVDQLEPGAEADRDPKPKPDPFDMED